VRATKLGSQLKRFWNNWLNGRAPALERYERPYGAAANLYRRSRSELLGLREDGEAAKG
jgi:hypothetical protein